MKNFNLKEISNSIEKYTKYSIEQIKVNDRTLNITYARHLFCYFAVNYTEKSLMDIAYYINRHHSTIIHGNKRILTELYHDRRVFLDCEKIYDILTQELPIVVKDINLLYNCKLNLKASLL